MDRPLMRRNSHGSLRPTGAGNDRLHAGPGRRAAQAAVNKMFDGGDCAQVRADATLVVCYRLAQAAAAGTTRAEAARDWLKWPV